METCEQLCSPTYIPLRNHSSYSLLEGAMHVDQLLERAHALNLPALALCDTSNLFGAMEFSLACQKYHIQPLLGCLLRIHAGDRETTAAPVLPVYVQNQEGYHNLCRLITATTVDQEDAHRGYVTFDQLKGKTEGLLALSGGAAGLLDMSLRRRDEESAKKALETLMQLFPGRLYLEVQRYGLFDEERIEEHLFEWAEKKTLPVLATNDAFFLDEKTYAAHDALCCIAEGTYVGVQDRKRLTPHHHFKTPSQMAKIFADVPEVLQNTVTFAQRCHFLLKSSPPMLPHGRDDTSDEPNILRRLTTEGLLQRGKEQNIVDLTPYKERLSYELDVIIKMGFAGYFLIVADFIQWAKKQKIPVGPGRGSGASSLVAWALTITDVNPIRFNLLFERFLNPERISMPDFDIDFCQERRDEVIQYVQQKYGKERVAHIITFGKLQARAVLRDVGRVLQMPYNQVDRLCKRIPNNPAHPVTLEQAVTQDVELQEQEETDPQVKQLLTFGRELEGLYRHASTHAAGIVISRDPLVELLPLYQDPRSLLPATQFSMKYVELAGLVKFDFLGLKTLTILEGTVKLLANRDISVNLSTIPLDDPKTFALLRRVETVGIFQVESTGMSDVLRQLQPEAFEEIIALVALYRPGPMDDIPRYLACRHGREKVTYPYACLEGILRETFGVMVYQEQVLQIAQVLAGYSLGSADILRRAMGKKIKREMDAQRKIFVEGAVKNHGGKAETASQLFDQISKFAGYAFNKAHATPYALLTYQTAYLKANFPVEFMVASLNAEIHNTDKLAFLVREARRMKIPLLPPDINASQGLFSIDATHEGQSGIRYGLAALKNVGEGAMDVVFQERVKRGPFQSIHDFIERLESPKTINKRQMESLIQAGTFDLLHDNRKQLLASLDRLLKYGAQKSDHLSLFSLEETRPPLESTPPFPPLEKLRCEFSSIGFYLRQHPLEMYADRLKDLPIVSSDCVVDVFQKQGELRSFLMVGVLMGKQDKTSKTGKKYAFAQFSDLSGPYETTLFSEALSQFQNMLEPGKPFLLTLNGRLEDNTVRLSIQKVQDLDTLLAPQIFDVQVRDGRHLERLAQFLQQAPSGSTKIRLFLPTQSTSNTSCFAVCVLPKPIRLSPDLRETLQNL